MKHFERQPVRAGSRPRRDATGFLPVKSSVLRAVVERLNRPPCNRKWGRSAQPFFQHLVVPHSGCEWHNLGEDWTFNHRPAQVGVTPLADTAARLWHYGSYGFGWADAGTDPKRFRDYTFRVERNKNGMLKRSNVGRRLSVWILGSGIEVGPTRPLFTLPSEGGQRLLSALPRRRSPTR